MGWTRSHHPQISKWLCGILLLAGVAGAQPLMVYSGLAEVNPQTAQAEAPRHPHEILSPAVMRNGYTSLQIAVHADSAETWRLFVAQNPEGTAKATVYRLGTDGNTLIPVRLPYEGSGSAVFWLDLFFPANAPAQRIKIEPQLRYRNDWVIYPMEARVVQATVPANAELVSGNAPPGDVMRGFLCGTRIEAEPEEGAAPTKQRLRFRNAQQDRAIAPGVDRAALQEKFGPCDAVPPADDPEWYLRVRNYLLNQK